MSKSGKAVNLAPMGKAKPQHKVQKKFKTTTSNRAETIAMSGRAPKKVTVVGNRTVAQKKQAIKNSPKKVGAPVTVKRLASAKTVIGKKPKISKGTKGGNGTKPRKTFGL